MQISKTEHILNKLIRNYVPFNLLSPEGGIRDWPYETASLEDEAVTVPAGIVNSASDELTSASALS